MAENRTENKWLLLKAREENWSLLYDGCWEYVDWQIFNDGSYEIVTSFVPEMTTEMLIGKEESIPVLRKTEGQMDEESFSRLKEAVKGKPWKDPSLVIHACDGVAWELKSFTRTGRVRNSSGKLGYIYGNPVLEAIVDLLPGDQCIYDSDAFVIVSRKKD